MEKTARNNLKEKEQKRRRKRVKKKRSLIWSKGGKKRETGNDREGNGKRQREREYDIF